MTTRQDINRLSTATSRLTAAAQDDLTMFFRSLDLTLPEAARDELIEFLPRLTQLYGDAAATAAAEWFEELRAGAVGTPYEAVLADPVDDAQVSQTAHYAAGHLFTSDPEQALSVLSSATQRYVAYMSRATVARNAAHDPARPRWARVPAGAHTCAFCAMLASRGFVYRSEDKAGGDAHRFHDDCHCQIVPEWGRGPAHIEGYDPDKLFGQYEEARRAALDAGQPASPENVLAYMRRMHPESFTDGIKPSL
nr:MAG TPA: minor capsid protein [Caudoviricetes sp.]